MPFNEFRFYNGGDDPMPAGAEIEGNDGGTEVVTASVTAVSHTESSTAPDVPKVRVTKIVHQNTKITVGLAVRTLSADVDADGGTHFEEAVAVLPEIDPAGPAYLVCRVAGSNRVKIGKFGAPVTPLSEDCEDPTGG